MKLLLVIAAGIVILGILIAYSQRKNKTLSSPKRQYPESIDEILARPDDLDIIFAIQEKISRKQEETGFESLTAGERIFLCVENLEMEINNGGFDQYFFNSAGDLARYTPEALEVIGAKYTADIVLRACSLFPDAKPPRNRTECQRILNDFGDADKATLEQLDAEFYEYRDNIGELLIDYVRKNKEQFSKSSQ